MIEEYSNAEVLNLACLKSVAKEKQSSCPAVMDLISRPWKTIFSCVGIFIMLLVGVTDLSAQAAGINYDPCTPVKGALPYEMEGRVEPREPLATFTDCNKWTIEASGGNAMLYRTKEEHLYRDYSGKLRYIAKESVFEVTIRLDTPVVIPDPWDGINFWNYGANGFSGDAIKDYVLIEDADGGIHELPFVQSGYAGLVYRYWFMNHITLTEKIKGPAKFVGIKFKTKQAVDTSVYDIYLGPVYFYEQSKNSLHYPAWLDSLAFPTRKETILPLNKINNYTDCITDDGNPYKFIYNGADVRLTYLVDVADGYPFNIKLSKQNGDTIELFHNSKIVFGAGGEGTWTLKEAEKDGDTLRVKSEVVVDGQKSDFSFNYTINQKSLICELKEMTDTGRVDSIILGNTRSVGIGGKLFAVPFLNFTYNDAPKILYSDDLFYFTQFDWYYTNSSKFYASTPGISNGNAVYNGGVQYIPKTDGRRNPLQERLFINVSPDVQEVFPTIANPKSPFRLEQGDRLWRNPGSPSYDAFKYNTSHIRGMGMDKVSINFHEGIWRDEEESYTFKLHVAPSRGDAQVKNEIQYGKDRGFMVGLYTNYTDLATVNANWDEDWVLKKPNGAWNVSWARCYSPKPMKAWEIQQINAPIIHDRFGSDFSYCDVATAVTPMALVDYDARVPGAGMFRRTYECYGLLLLNEKKAYQGPVYSEGGTHWLYAGLSDGNFSRSQPSLDQFPIFPDFQLLKIHPLEMDMGIVGANEQEYLAYTLAYGNIGWLNCPDPNKLKRYSFLNTLQPFYSMIPIKQIKYESGRVFYSTSDALVRGINGNDEARLMLEYESGLKAYINFSTSGWKLALNGKNINLPHWGVYAFTNNDSAECLSGFKDDIVRTGTAERIDIVKSPEQYYMDTYGDYIYTNMLAGNGKVMMKKDSSKWIITPALKFYEFGFDPVLMGLDSSNISLKTIMNDWSAGPAPETRWSRGKLFIMGSRNGMLRYNVIFDSTSRPPEFTSSTFYLVGLDSITVSVPSGFNQDISTLTWHLGGSNPAAGFHKAGDDIWVKCPPVNTEKKHVWLEIKSSENKVFWIDFFTKQ